MGWDWTVRPTRVPPPPSPADLPPPSCPCYRGCVRVGVVGATGKSVCRVRTYTDTDSLLRGCTDTDTDTDSFVRGCVGKGLGEGKVTEFEW